MEVPSQKLPAKITAFLIYLLLVAGALYLLVIATGITIRFPFKTSGPKITVRPPSVDFGVMNQLDSPARRVVTLRNLGGEPAQLTMVRASTRALMLGKTKRTIAPGAEIELDVTFDPIGLSGPQEFEVSFVSNEAQAKQERIPVQATIDHSIRRRPGFRMEQLMLDQPCRACHLEPGLGKDGADLYAAVCADCHGKRGRSKKHGGPLTASKRGDPEKNRADLEALITRGRPGTAMPAWGREGGGFLADKQVESLVNLIMDWRDKPAMAK